MKGKILLKAAAAAIALFAGFSAAFYANGITASADNTESGIEYVLSSSIDEENEDGQRPVQSVLQAQTSPLLYAAAVNIQSGKSFFGISVPVHNAMFAAYDKYIGIDVSKWNGDIDWKKVKAAGIEHAIIRVGYRGYGSAGTLVLDDKFKKNIKEAIANDIKVGVYFFTQAINTAEAIEEAKFAIEQIKNYNITLPVIIDIEEAIGSDGKETGRVYDAKLTKTQYTNICSAFCDTVEAAGYEPMVYANSNWLNNKLNASKLESNYGIWLANYTNETSYAGLYQLWQYSSRGKVSGITTNTDLNIFYMIPPQTPKNLNASVAKDKTVTVSWDKAPGAEGYVIYSALITDGQLVYTTLGETSKTSYKAPAGSGDIFAVASYKTESGKKIYSEISQEVYVNSDNASPTGLSVSKYTSSSLALTWDEYPEATSYGVYIREKEDGAFTLTAETETNSVTLKNLKSATEYDIKVCAYLSESQTPFTQTFGAATSPAVPQNVEVSSVKANAVTVSWDAVEGAERYLVYMLGRDPEQYRLVMRTNKNSVEITGLDSAKTYYFKIRSVVDADSMTSYSSPSKAAETCTKPAKVSSVSSSVSTNSVTLKWEKTGENVTYRIYKYNFKTSEYERIAETKSPSYTVKNLSQFTKYNFAVNSVNKNKVTGGYASTGNVYTTVAKTTGLKTSAKSTSVTLSWSKVSGASGYTVYTLSSDGSYKSYKTVKTNSITISSVPHGKSYTFKVRAYKVIDGANRYGAYSDPAYIATTPQTVKKVTFDHTKAKEKTVTISWSKVPYATGYYIYRYDSSSKSYKSIAKATGSSATITLDPGKDYTLKVRAYTSVGGKNYYGGYSPAVNTFTRCAAPTNISIGANTTSSVTLKWSKQTGARGYAIYRYNSSKKTYTYIGKTTSTSYKISGLSAGSTYQYAIKAYRAWSNALWYSGYSKVCSVCTTPQKPTGLKYSTSTDSTVTLSWTKVSGASGYRIYSYDSSRKKYTYLADVKGTSATVTGLSTNKEYKFAVRAYKTCNSNKYYSSYSSTVKGKTAPAAPKSVKASSITENSVTITWSKSSGASGYRIYKYDYTAKKYVVMGEVTSLTYTFKNLDSGEKCTFAVKPFVKYNGKNRYSSKYNKVTCTVIPAAPKSVKASSITENSVTITWSKSSGASGYRIYKYDYTAKKYVVMGEVTSLTYTFKNLDPGEKCTFAVKPFVKYNGKNRYSSKYNKVTCTVIPAAPKSVKASSITENSVTITWSKSSGASGYRIYKYDYTAKKYVVMGEVTSLTYTFKNLDSGEKCTFAVKPFVKYNGKNRYSSKYNKVTCTVIPAAPKSVKASSITENSVTITWSKSSGASGYRIYKYDYTAKKYVVMGEVTSLTYTFKNLDPGEKCTFAVKPFVKYNGKNRYSSKYNKVTCTVIPAAPKSVKASSITENSVTITWSKSSGASGYRIYKYDYTAKKYVVMGEVTSLTYTFKNLDPGEKCTFAVKPFVKYNGKNRYSSKYNKVTCTVIPAAPKSVKASSITENSVTITWSKSSGASGYRIYKYDYTAKKYVVMGEVTSLTYTFKNLDPGEKCTFAVKPFVKYNGKNWYSSKYNKVTCVTLTPLK